MKEDINYTHEPSEVEELDTAKSVSQTEIRYIPLYRGGEDEREKVEHLHRFYSVEQKISKKGEYIGYSIELDNYIIIDVLKELGFYRYDQPNGTFEYVKIKNNIITLLHDSQVIIDAFEDYVKNLPVRYYKISDFPTVVKEDKENNIRYLKEAHIEITSEILLKRIYKNIMYYFSSTLPRLRPSEPIRLLQDTKDSKYIFYNNCVVRISKDDVMPIEYDELDMLNDAYGENNGTYIWSNNILDRDFPRHMISIDGKKTHEYNSDFEIFVDFICGLSESLKEIKVGDQVYHSSNWVENYLNTEYSGSEAKILSIKRKAALMNIFGYLMHNNYECNMKSVMFIDMNKDNKGKPAGGTGKGIIGKALSHMLNRTENDSKYIAVAGKNFDPEDERRYSEGDLTTQLIHIEDIKRGFNFEAFFNDVTDGAVFRKMYQDKTKHKVKLLLSSNQPLDLSAPSCKRRMVVFELDNFFSESKTPQDVFGKRFFESQWTEYDWAMFDVFMIQCCSQYMKEKDKIGSDGKVIGLRQPPLLNYANTLLYSKLPEDFIAWFEAKISSATKDMIEHTYSKDGLYSEFTTKYTEYANERIYKRAFTGWCKFYLETMKIPSAERRSTVDVIILYPNNINDPKNNYIYR